MMPISRRATLIFALCLIPSAALAQFSSDESDQAAEAAQREADRAREEEDRREEEANKREEEEWEDEQDEKEEKLREEAQRKLEAEQREQYRHDMAVACEEERHAEVERGGTPLPCPDIP
jgi:hypothetical protein